MPKRRLALWVAAIAAVHTVAATAISMDELFARQSSCAPKFTPCKNADFPDYFCCKPTETCIPLAGNTTLLCCPEGSDCLRIKPVPCDISLQDGEKNPDAVIKTTALRGTLARCGTQCCPFGYSCVNGQCVKDRNQNAVPIQTRTGKPGPTPTDGSKPSSTNGVSPTADTTDSVGNPNETAGSANDSNDSSSGPPVAAIAGGVTAAAVVLIGAAVLAFFFLRKKKKGASKGRSPLKLSRSTSSFGNLISRPVMAENSNSVPNDYDFIRPTGPSNSAQEAEPDSVTGAVLGSSINSPEAGPMPTVPLAAALAPEPQNHGGYGGYGQLEQPQYVDMPYVDYDGGLMPQTPQQNREPSSVSINVFADPNITPDRSPESNADGRRYTNMTSFTQMLDNADLGGIARGESYLQYDPNSGQVPPMPRQ
ncbi:hypothetical protein VTI28DRAFT_1943 [Corynascus sepedonium]